VSEQSVKRGEARRRGRSAATALAPALLLPAVLAAQPTILPTAEGQWGTALTEGDGVLSANFWIFPPSTTQLSWVVRVTSPSGGGSPVQHFDQDIIGGPSSPIAIDQRTASFDEVAEANPAVAPWLDGNDGIAGVFSQAEDGSTAGTLAVVVGIVPTEPAAAQYVVLDDIPTAPFSDPNFTKTGIVADDQGRITVAFAEFSTDETPVPKVRALRLDKTGGVVDSFLDIAPTPSTSPDIALLDPNGERLIVSYIDLSDNLIKGTMVDTTGSSPVVLPEFPISTTSGLFNINPAVAADPATGEFLVAWDKVTGTAGNPVDVMARRFDADGLPLGPEFAVNTTTANAQGQPDVAFGPNGESVITWAGDSPVMGDYLDVFLQAYDANGQPIGGETLAGTRTAGVQEWPQVQFLAEPDSEGRAGFLVAWRDVVSDSDNTPYGTGLSYRRWAIGDAGDSQIFEDGFETGNRVNWGDVVP
jgi:hypothetical protein